MFGACLGAMVFSEAMVFPGAMVILGALVVSGAMVAEPCRLPLPSGQGSVQQFQIFVHVARSRFAPWTFKTFLVPPSAVRGSR